MNWIIGNCLLENLLCFNGMVFQLLSKWPIIGLKHDPDLQGSSQNVMTDSSQTCPICPKIIWCLRHYFFDEISVPRCRGIQNTGVPSFKDRQNNARIFRTRGYTNPNMYSGRKDTFLQNLNSYILNWSIIFTNSKHRTKTDQRASFLRIDRFLSDVWRYQGEKLWAKQNFM